MKQPRPHIKRHIRDPLAQWPAHVSLALSGPLGVGKRTLGQKLPQTRVEIAHRRGAPPSPHRSIRLHPLTVRELGLQETGQFMTLMGRGGFPAQIWAGSEGDLAKTVPKHMDELIQSLWGMDPPSSRRGAPAKRPRDPRALMRDLMARIGQPLSIHAMASAFGVSHSTMKRWIEELEHHHGLFRLKPFADQQARAVFRPIKKDQKAYPYDWSLGCNNQARLEALVAVHLLAWVESGEDLFGRRLTLHYLRDCDQREVDFLISDNDKPILLVQCEPSIARPSPHLVYFQKKFPTAQAWHLSLEHSRCTETLGSVKMAHPLDFLMTLDHEHSRQVSPDHLE